MFKSNNIVARIFERQIRTPAPGTSVNCARRFYENLVPSCTIYNVECPDLSFRKFTDDGQYLISFSKNYQDLIVYRPTWLSFSCKEEDSDSHDLPSKTKRFESFFTQLYCVSLASSNEFICKDFFLYLESNQFGIFASQTAQVYDAPAIGGAVHGVPSIEKITFHLVRLNDGVVLDEKVYCNDFVNLAHSMGVFLYDDLLAIMSLRYQTIHILQIRESGNLVDVRAIGPFCLEDDELFLNSHAQYMEIQGKSKQPELPINQGGNGLQHHQQSRDTSFLSGIKQRLLSFIFRGIWNEEKDQTLRVQCLKKKFYYHFQDYVDLIMWKVQFLDRHHLLIKFGSVDGGVSRNTDQQSAFLAVYNMEATEIIAFYQNSADEFFHLFEQFCDHFHSNSKNLSYMNFISSHSNNIHALEQLRNAKNKAISFSQFVKKTMATLPFSCQSQSPSPYFDQSLFRFDEKIHTKKRNRLEQQRLNDLVFVRYNKMLKERFDHNDTVDPISLANINDSSKWLLGLSLDDDATNDLVTEGDSLTWGDVERASGIGASSRGQSRASSSSQHIPSRSATATVDRSRKGKAPMNLRDIPTDDEEDEEVEREEEEEEEELGEDDLNETEEEDANILEENHSSDGNGEEEEEEEADELH